MTDKSNLPVTLKAFEPLPPQVVDVLLANGFKVIEGYAEVGQFFEFNAPASALAELMPNYQSYAYKLNENDLARATVHNGGVMVLGISLQGGGHLSVQDGYTLRDFPLFKGGLVPEDAQAALRAMGIPLAPFEAVAAQVTAPATPKDVFETAAAFCTKHLAEISADILASRACAPEVTGRFQELANIYRGAHVPNHRGMAESTAIAQALELAAGQLKSAT